MASASFIAKCKASYAKPRLYFDYQYFIEIPYLYDYTNKIIYMSPIKRSANLGTQVCQVTLDNSDNTFDELFENHMALGRKAVIRMGFGGITNYQSDTISFHENTPNADTIEDSASGFLDYGFTANSVITVADTPGVGINDGNYTIDTVTADTITLIATDDLVNEAEGDTVNIETETITLFDGHIEKVEFDYKAGTVTVFLKDRISMLLENRVINADLVTDVKLNWFEYGVRQDGTQISNIVWTLLTTYGKLDPTASTDNDDIDYTSWVAWKAIVDGDIYSPYDLFMIANGETVSNIVSEIARLTESMIWIGSEGKVKFISSFQTVTGQTYTTDELLEVKLDVSLEGRVNYITMKIKYLPNYDYFYESDWIDSDLYGPTEVPYTYQSETEQGRIVGHNSGSAGSANYYTDEKLKRTAAPPRIFTLETDLLGFVEDVGNTSTLSDLWATVPYDDIDVILTDVEFDFQACRGVLKGNYLWTAGELA